MRAGRAHARKFGHDCSRKREEPVRAARYRDVGTGIHDSQVGNMVKGWE